MSTTHQPSSPPPDDELVLGLVGALGVNLEDLCGELQAVLSEFGYHPYDLHLTDAYKDFDWPDDLVSAPYDERVWSYMDVGDVLRSRWERRDAMALLAVARVAAQRTEVTGSPDIPARRTAYVLRSLKRPEEIQLLRAVYGGRFFLIGAATTDDARVAYLRQRIRRSRLIPHPPEPAHSIEELMRRDEKDPDVPHGQNVRDTFHRADVFVDTSQDLPAQLMRAFDVLHGSPRCSPTRDEFGMAQAFAAAMRSAELGRQVGAAICTADGDIIAVGTNEVPKPEGGLYWAGDPDDARDVSRGEDSNSKRRQAVANEIASAMEEADIISPGADTSRLLPLVEAGSFGGIIEYVRAVHAEMAVITDAARRGAQIDGATLYATTFPCHHCARHIVAAGLDRVVFVAPYAKSLAVELHGDALVLGRRADGDRRVPFEPFVGLGPARYTEFFAHEDRKDPSDPTQLRPYDRMTADARIWDRDPADLRSDRLPYLDREGRALVLLSEAEHQDGFAMRRDEPAS